MAIKVVINQIGQQLIADVKQIENKETKEVVGYLLEKPRLVNYGRGENEGEIAVNFAPYCLLSDDDAVSIRADSAVAIVNPRDEVIEKYQSVVNNDEVRQVELEGQTEEVTDESVAADTEEG
jgi:hypothetical protein